MGSIKYLIAVIVIIAIIIILFFTFKKVNTDKLKLFIGKKSQVDNLIEEINKFLD
jgi:hypothetical protein